MKKNSLDKLIEGYREFYKSYVDEANSEYLTKASKSQNPKVMMIACSDSRITPSILTNSALGEVFMVRNVANIVPPYKIENSSHHSTSSALEFAVNHLSVEHIIILGHSGCGGIKALMEGSDLAQPGVYSFIKSWVEIASDAKDYVLKNHDNLSKQKQLELCEKISLRNSLDNLKTFPWIKNAVENGSLNIHAWHFDIESGVITQYLDNEKVFAPLVNNLKE